MCGKFTTVFFSKDRAAAVVAPLDRLVCDRKILTDLDRLAAGNDALGRHRKLGAYDAD
jgi:hypothetical protein